MVTGDKNSGDEGKEGKEEGGAAEKRENSKDGIP